MQLAEVLILIVVGLIAGFAGGTLGIGGGIVIVPALVFILGFTQHHAQGTSLAVLLFPIGILGVINYAKAGYVNFKIAAILILAFIAGSYLGSKFAISMPEKTLKQIFGLFMLFVSIKMIIGK
jgi:hypothetical protein